MLPESIRTSSYVHYLPGAHNGHFTLVHGYTGAVDEVSSNVVGFLLDHRAPEKPGTHTKDESLACEALKGQSLEPPDGLTIEMLRSRGYLTQKSIDEERKYVQHLVQWFHNRSVANPGSTFMVIPTYECNLRCPYCFEGTTRVQLNKHGILREVMSPSRVDDALSSMDRLLEQRQPPSSAGSRLWEGRELGLFGGEPLQEMTLGITEYILERCRERGARIGAVTNAVDLHLFESLLGPQGIQRLQVTLDGPKEVHDMKRIGPAHRHTYDRILDNVQMAVSRGTHVAMRIHTDWTTVNRTPELLEEFDRRGLSGRKNFTRYITGRNQWHAGQSLPIYPNMAPSEVYQVMQKLPDPVFVQYGGLVEKKLRAYLQGGLVKLADSVEYCSANTGGMLLFDPYGYLYSCWEMAGRAHERTGTYSAEGVQYMPRYADWTGRSPANIAECSNCKYVLFHFGGCAGMPAEVKHDLLAPACESFPDSFVTVAREFFDKGKHRLINVQTGAAAAPDAPIAGNSPVPGAQSLSTSAAVSAV